MVNKKGGIMKQTVSRLIALLLFCICITGLQAQESINTSGGEASGTNGSVSYSVGQQFYSTYTGSDGSVAQGVQQPYEITTVVGLEDAKGIILSCVAYPNPTTDILTLRVEDYDLDGLTYVLFSMNGNMLESQKITSESTSISLAKHLRGTYFLKVMGNNKTAKTFSIIKN